jgi:hypothetical protein
MLKFATQVIFTDFIRKSSDEKRAVRIARGVWIILRIPIFQSGVNQRARFFRPSLRLGA